MQPSLDSVAVVARLILDSAVVVQSILGNVVAVQSILGNENVAQFQGRWGYWYCMVGRMAGELLGRPNAGASALNATLQQDNHYPINFKSSI